MKRDVKRMGSGAWVGLVVVAFGMCHGLCSCDLRRGTRACECDAAEIVTAEKKAEVARRKMVVEVVDGKSGKRMEGVSVSVSGVAGKAEFEVSGKSDLAGKVELSVPVEGVTYFYMTAEKAGYVPMRAQWPAFNSRVTGQEVKLPEGFKFALPEGTQIGGRVVDDGGKGVEGATVVVAMRGSRAQAVNQMPDVVYRSVKTGADGKWTYGQAPGVFGEASVGAYHMAYDSGKGYGWYAMNEVGEASLRDGSAVITLNRGVRVEGRVVDGTGAGVARAVIALGDSRFGSNSLPEVMSDKEGYFGVCGPVDGKLMVTVKAKGYAPELKTLKLGKEKEAVEFVMKPGKTLKGRVVDAGGAPVEGVMVVADTWRGARTLDTRLTTDGQGRFEWKEAPEYEVLFHVLKMGYGDLRDTRLTAGKEEVTVVMRNPTVVKGSVVDEETGKGVESFSVTPGMVSFEGPGRQSVYWERDERKVIKGVDGVFEFTVNYPRAGHMVRVEAKGYAPMDSRVFKDEEGKVELAFKLEKARNIEGVVRGLDGKPAAGVEVILIGPRSQLRWVNGKFEPGGMHGVVRTVTDGEGRYWFVPQKDAFLLAVLGEGWFGELAGDEAVKHGEIQLKRWGRVEGRVMRGMNTEGNVEVEGGREMGDEPDAFDKPWVRNRLKTKTDGEGRFALERVPEGEVRVFQTEMNSQGHLMSSRSELVEVKAGETARVTIGGMGRPVTGRAEIPPEFRGDGYRVSGYLITKYEVKEPARPPMPAGHEAFSSEQRMAWWKAFYASEEGKAYAKAYREARAKERRATKAYAIDVGNDGAFKIGDVAAGRYRLSVAIYPVGSGTPVASGEMEVVVPEMATGRSDEVLEVGGVKVVRNR
jgi:hypothetical protein